MIKQLLIRGLLFTFLIISWSCSKDITEPFQPLLKDFEKESFVSKKVEPEQIPQIMEFINQQSHGDMEFALQNERSDTRNHEDDLVLTSVLTDQISQVTNNEGKSSYTFELIQGGDRSEIYFLNLIVKEYGDELYLFIIKYVPDIDWLKSYKTDHDFARFTGMIYYYNSEGAYIGKGTMVNGSSVSTENRNPCTDPDDPNNPDNPTGGGGSTDGSMPIGDNTTGGGIYIIVVTVYHTIPTGETFEFGPGSVCQHPGECIVTVVVEFIYSEQDRSMRDLVNCPPPADCFDINGDPCANGCDENNQCIEDPSEIESGQSGILISSDLQRLADQMNNLVGPDSYEFFIPSSEEETLNFDSFQEFETYYNNNLEEFQLTEEEFIVDGQFRTDHYLFQIDPILNTNLFVSIFTEQVEPNSEECMSIIDVASSLVGNTSILSWEQYENFSVTENVQNDILTLQFYGALDIGINIEGWPFKITRVYTYNIDYRYSTGELIHGWCSAIN